ncbi:MAG: hypothetical protein E7050_02860 [Lentisphaerae bacterium]|nr:hypothetical protein [Lentisphaerota bacterium]
MFKFRIIGFILLMGLLGGIFFWSAGGKWLFLAAAPALVGAAVGECCAMLNKSGRPAYVLPTALAVWLVAVASLLAGFFKFEGFIHMAVILILLLILASCASLLTVKKEMLEKVLNSFGSGLLLTPSLVGLLLAYIPDPCGYWLIYLCLVTKATDTGGYIVGTLTSKLPGGNHKIAPNISPKKSYEGFVGGLLLSIIVSLAFFFCVPHAGLWWYILSAVVLSFGSFYGDLTESAIKRLCAIKDSGSFVPGMGGAFDVLDSFIYNGLLFWLLYTFKDVL